MGLDLIVENSARAGHEVEWQKFVERVFVVDEFTPSDRDRFAEISVPAYTCLGAPRVGFDDAADAWIVQAREAKTPEEKATTLKDFHGHYCLRLVQSDGVPEYSHGGLYDGVDETSFRGKFLEACGSVLPSDLIDDAGRNKWPEAAVRFGNDLLAAADRAARGEGPNEPIRKVGLLARLGLAKKPAEAIPLDEQLHIVRAAGRWFVFWGERGHPISTWI